MPAKVALMTGITAQEGSLLAEPLLGKGYVVHSAKRRSSSINMQRIDHRNEDPHFENANFFLHGAWPMPPTLFGCQLSEIYNFAAQCHIQVNFETPECMANVLWSRHIARFVQGDLKLAGVPSVR